MKIPSHAEPFLPFLTTSQHITQIGITMKHENMFDNRKGKVLLSTRFGIKK